MFGELRGQLRLAHSAEAGQHLGEHRGLARPGDIGQFRTRRPILETVRRQRHHPHPARPRHRLGRVDLRGLVDIPHLAGLNHAFAGAAEVVAGLRVLHHADQCAATHDQPRPNPPSQRNETSLPGLL